MIRMKTSVSTHTFGRVFNNKNAKSKWVATNVADRFRSSQGVRLVDIIGDIRIGYAVEGLGRPKKLRRREPNEDPNPTRLKRSHTKYACGYCQQYGHNSRKCTMRPATEEPTAPNETQGQNEMTSIANTTNPVEQIQILKNAHSTSMYMQSKTNIPLPPALTEANKILQQLMVIAQDVTFGNSYDWKNVANQLGLSKDEGYMNFMTHVEETKKFCAENGIQPTAAGGHSEGGGTQSEVISTWKDA
ncbi:hypothetical protein SESBI_16259 [Sesbania bispinosa]|nr:hypothetical protein SESBI_16259 [Sesbania bispinosa]